MGVNWKYVVGFTTIAGVLGVSAYAIILYKREQKESENEISLEDAKAIVEEGKFRGSVVDRDKKIDIPEDPSKIVDKVNYHKNQELIKATDSLYGATEWTNDEGFLEEHHVDISSCKDMTVHNVMARPLEEVEEENEKEDLELMEEELEEEKLEQEPILLIDEGEGKLRYDPNSDEALLQFMRMELAEWAPHEEVYKTLEFLYDIPFEPKVDGDVHLHNKLVDYRGEFFGPASRWTLRVSFADLILHFARLTDFNVGGGVRYWVGHFLENNRMNIFDMSDHHLEYMINLMNRHDFYYEDDNGKVSYGFFSLDKRSIDKATEIASRNIDGTLTYEIEFNEFLKNANNQ